MQNASMSQRPIRWYDASTRRPYAPRIPQSTWDEHHDLLKRMYLEEGMTLEDIMKVMKDEYAFTPSYGHLPFLPRRFCLYRPMSLSLSYLTLQEASVYVTILQQVGLLQEARPRPRGSKRRVVRGMRRRSSSYRTDFRCRYQQNLQQTRQSHGSEIERTVGCCCRHTFHIPGPVMQS